MIKIEDIKKKIVVDNDFNIEFNLIITDKLEIFFVEKYIKIKVKGEISAKYPKFYFQFEQYKLTLDDEIMKYKKEKEEDSNDKSEKEKKKNNIIINIENVKNEEKNNNEDNQYLIGMCPDYSIKNEEFFNLLMQLKNNNNENDEKRKNIKGPQEEIMDILFDLNNLLISLNT
jgi:hypothetical protein